jgi:anti-sigma B factor antagonist
MADPKNPFRLEGLEIQTVAQGTTRVVTVEGELDLGGCPELEAALNEAESSDVERIVLDLSEVNFIDSTGIALLIAAMRRSEQDSDRLRLVPSKSEAVQRLIELCGLDGHLAMIEHHGQGLRMRKGGAAAP